MNKKRRKKLDAIMATLENCETELLELQELEQEAHDNLPENIQAGERGEGMQATIDKLEEAISDINNGRMILLGDS